MNYDRLVQDVIDEHRVSPIDILGIGDMSGEFIYLESLKSSYIRTVMDVDSLFKSDKSSKHILEIGSYLGVVSIALKRLGYRVSALDIPEFHRSDALKKLYANNGIPFTGMNLKYTQLPYESNSIDVVIACEVFEHLNFNPLPVFSEINRVLGSDGYIYIGMPNQASFVNRLKLIFGKSIHNPIEDYYRQLDRNDNMIVGLHWREYTLSETTILIEKMGFETVYSYHFSDNAPLRSGLAWMLLRRILYLYPPFRSFQVVIGKKKRNVKNDFWITEASS